MTTQDRGGPAEPSPERPVVVVGGGLAGLAAALRLSERDLPVVLVESAEHLGGKAGAKVIDGAWEDHGYHVFFPWYRNVEQLISDVGARANFVESHAYHQLAAGEFPEFSASWSAPSLRVLGRGNRFGALGTADQVLLLYSVIDLLGRRYQVDDYDESCGEFFDSRPYLTPPVRDELDRLISTAVTPPPDFSARTLRRAMTGYVRHPRPLCRVPRTDLHHDLIEPITRRLLAAGGEIRTGHRVVDVQRGPGGVTAVDVEGPDGTDRWPVAGVVLAVPHHAVAEIGDGSLAEPGVLTGRGLHDLISRPLAALHLHMNVRVADLPREHVALVGSRYATSFLDLARMRPDLDTSVLNLCIVPGELTGQPPEKIARTVVDELSEYVPEIRWDTVDRFVYQDHGNAPFYGNDAYSWPDRPEATTRVPNVWVAGDHARSYIDLACMEGAVTTGLLAAEAVRARYRPASAPVTVHEVADLPPRVFAAITTLLRPVAALLARIARRRAVAQPGPRPVSQPTGRR